jgi:hypothetical protein
MTKKVVGPVKCLPNEMQRIFHRGRAYFYGSTNLKIAQLRKKYRKGLTMKTNKILLDHGSGGIMFHRLVTDLMLPIFDYPMPKVPYSGATLEKAFGRHSEQMSLSILKTVFPRRYSPQRPP